jgi:hypothetical protein
VLLSLSIRIRQNVPREFCAKRANIKSSESAHYRYRRAINYRKRIDVCASKLSERKRLFLKNATA